MNKEVRSKLAKRKTERNESDFLALLRICLTDEVYNEELKTANFTSAKLSDTSGVLKVYVDTLNRDNLPRLIKQLNNFKGIFRTYLAKHTDHYHVPNILFVPDDTMDNYDKITKILAKI